MIREKIIKLTVLGSGTCIPRTDRASPGFFVTVEESKILLDCGPGTVRQLVKAGRDYKDIDLVIISHLHLDHTSDLPAFLFALNHTPDFKRTKDLILLGGKGFKKFFDNLIKTLPDIKPKPLTYRIKLLEEETNVFKSLKIETIPGNHHPSSITVKLKAFRKKIVYTGDTDYDRAIIRFSNKADLLISECSYPDSRKVEGHLTPTLAGKIAAEARIKTLLLTHFYPPVDKIDISSVVKKYFSGKIIVAEDLMTLKI